MITQKFRQLAAMAMFANISSVAIGALFTAPAAYESVSFASDGVPKLGHGMWMVDQDVNGADSGDLDQNDTNSGGAGERPGDRSEDGTIDTPGASDPEVVNPDLANPEQPPSCPYTHQPLELLI